MYTIDTIGFHTEFVNEINWKEVLDSLANMDNLEDGSELQDCKFLVRGDENYVYHSMNITSCNSGPYNRLSFKSEITEEDLAYFI